MEENPDFIQPLKHPQNLRNPKSLVNTQVKTQLSSTKKLRDQQWSVTSLLWPMRPEKFYKGWWRPSMVWVKLWLFWVWFSLALELGFLTLLNLHLLLRFQLWVLWHLGFHSLWPSCWGNHWSQCTSLRRWRSKVGCRFWLWLSRLLRIWMSYSSEFREFPSFVLLACRLEFCSLCYQDDLALF